MFWINILLIIIMAVTHFFETTDYNKDQRATLCKGTHTTHMGLLHV